MYGELGHAGLRHHHSYDLIKLLIGQQHIELYTLDAYALCLQLQCEFAGILLDQIKRLLLCADGTLEVKEKNKTNILFIPSSLEILKTKTKDKCHLNNLYKIIWKSKQ